MTTFIAPVRNYKFSDARLVEISFEKIAFAQRDNVELLTRGITATWVDDLNTQTLAFAALPGDDVELGEQEEATEEKATDADLLMEKMKDLRSAVARAFGEGSTEYGRFGFKGLDKFTDAELLKAALVAHGLATTYAAPLAAKGFLAADNTELQTMCSTFVSGIQHQRIETGSRDIAQEDRVKAGNDLYALLEKELCEAGKSYWRTRSAAKYNDYIIYNTSSGTSGSVIREGNVAAGETKGIDTSGVNPTPASMLTIDITGGPLQFFASDTSGGAPIGPIYEVPVGTVAITPADFSTNTGFSDGKFLNVRNTGAVTAHYKITVDHL